MKKNHLTRLLATSLLIVMILALSFGPAIKVSASASGDKQQQDFMPAQLIVGVSLAQGKPVVNIAELAIKVSATVQDTALDESAYLLKFTSEAAAVKAIDALKGVAGIQYIERNGISRIPPIDQTIVSKDGAAQTDVGIQTYTPNDSLDTYQWHLDKILYHQTALPETNPPCVVVIDTGVDYTHPDLSGKVYKGYDYFDSDADPMDVNGHGTHVSGIIAGKTNNWIGISGVSPNSNILAVRVLGPDGWGTNWMVAQGILYANGRTSTSCGGQTPKVYNMSLGGGYSSAVENAVHAAYDLGRLVVVAAGNDNTSSTTYANPGASTYAMGVAATEQTDHRTYFSNYDTAAAPWVDIAAPGYKILSTVPGGYAYFNGTSMATPVVAGVAARVWAKYPAWTPNQIYSRLLNTADPTLGFPRAIGRVDLARALDYTARTLQGTVYDAATIVPEAGASVTVKLGTAIICTTVTNGAGFYTCTGLPSTGTYTVFASKTGHPTGYLAVSVATTFKFNADVFMSTTLGTSTSNDWTITTQWPSFQPFNTSPGQGMETDLWIVDATASPNICYNAYWNPMDADPWWIMLPRDSYGIGQSEGAWISHLMGNYGHNLQVWVTVYDSGNWPSSTRITGSGLLMKIYKNNAAILSLPVPSTPTTADSDAWFVGTITFSSNSFVVANQIKTDAQVPSCVYP